jgi:peptide/nickel transport system permease protein
LLAWTLRRPYYTAGFVLLGLLVLSSVFAPLLAQADPTFQDLRARLTPPQWSGAHPLGTDSLGRDLWSRILYGGRISLLVGIGATIVAAVIGVGLGLVAGYAEGRMGTIIMGTADAQLAFPTVLLAIVVASTLGSSLVNVILVLALSGWVGFARPVYGLTLSLKTHDFVLAARALGATGGRIIVVHLLPHIFTTAAVLVTLQVARMILFESALSFLGMGVPPEVPTWGAMLSDARRYMQTAPWTSIFPGLAIVLTVLGINLTGDWLRDVVNPRHRQ